METLPVNSRRKILNHVVCGLLTEYEFVNCEKQAFETLTEMLQSCKYLY